MDENEIAFRVMTPDGYEDGTRRYPVVYINDGQDVFRDEHIIWGECSMDYENYYRAYKKYLPEIIIVALCCPATREERSALYCPWDLNSINGSEVRNGKGDIYLSWIVKELKPWVDDTYRTLPDAENTAIFGYSTGGLFAIYAALSKPQIFGRLAALSSAVYILKDQLVSFLEHDADYSSLQRIYMDVGTNEFGRISTKEDFLLGSDLLYHAYLEHGISPEKIRYQIFPGAVHSQTDWKLRFPDALRWIFP